MRLPKLLDILIPRFATEDVAVSRCPDRYCDGLHIVCNMADIEPGEVFDGIITVRCFNLFGFGLFPRQIGGVRPWANPWDGVSV